MQRQKVARAALHHERGNLRLFLVDLHIEIFKARIGNTCKQVELLGEYILLRAHHGLCHFVAITPFVNRCYGRTARNGRTLADKIAHPVVTVHGNTGFVADCGCAHAKLHTKAAFCKHPLLFAAGKHSNQHRNAQKQHGHKHIKARLYPFFLSGDTKVPPFL